MFKSFRDGERSALLFFGNKKTTYPEGKILIMKSNNLLDDDVLITSINRVAYHALVQTRRQDKVQKALGFYSDGFSGKWKSDFWDKLPEDNKDLYKMVTVVYLTVNFYDTIEKFLEKYKYTKKEITKIRKAINDRVSSV